MDIDKELIEVIENSIENYDSSIEIIEGLNFNQKENDKRIAFYSFNKYLSGNKDKYGRRKPYKQIINQSVELEASRTDIDITSIDLVSQSNDYIKTLVLEEELVKYAEDTRLNQVIQSINEIYIRYGSVLPKKTETGTELLIEPLNWLNATTDQRDVRNSFITEEHDFSLFELEKKQDIYENIEDILFQAKKNKQETVAVIDAEGEVDKAYITEKESDEGKIVVANIIYAKIGNKKYLLHKIALKETRFKEARRKGTQAVNRARGMGLVEEGFDPQISVNEAAIAQQIATSYSGMVISKTNSKNVESQLNQGIESGTTLFLEEQEYFDQEQLRPSDPSAFDAIFNTWEENFKGISNSFEAGTGEEGKVTPYRTQALKAKQIASTYDYRGESFNSLVKDIIKDWVLPFLVKKIKKEHILELKFSGSKGQILQSEIAKHNIFVKLKKDIINGKPWEAGKYNLELEKERVKQMVRPERKIKIPDSYFNDFLDGIIVAIGDDLVDTKAKMNAMYEIWQTKDPQDPTRKIIYEQMVELSNAISPLEIESPTPETGKKGEEKNPSISREMEGLMSKSQTQ